MWEKLAKYCKKTYGVQVDWDEEFFICPECGEPIYKDDWRDSDYALGAMPTLEDQSFYCPICEEVIYE